MRTHRHIIIHPDQRIAWDRVALVVVLLIAAAAAAWSLWDHERRTSALAGMAGLTGMIHQDPTPTPDPLPEPTPRTEADDINALIDAAIALVARPRDLLIYSERARYEAAAWALANQASSCALDWRFQPEIDRCCDALAQFAPEFIPYAPPCWR